MLDQDLAELAAADGNGSLADLEEAVWARVERVTQLRRFGLLTARAQLCLLGVTLAASAVVGAFAAQPSRSPEPAFQASLAAADLAPSSLLDPAR